MKGVVLAAVAALSIAGLLTPLVRNAATWLGAIDAPGGRRMHKNATPRMGGVAIVMAFWCAIGLCFSVGTHR